MSASSDYTAVAKAIHYLEENFLRQPSLDETAAKVGMSKFHLQRLFTRWAGVSPKRFLQFLTLEHAKGLLQASEPVLSAAFASGLSGPARLHDLFISTEGVTPGEYKSGGRSLDISFEFHPTPFGTGLFAQTERGLCHLSFLFTEDEKGRRSALSALATDWPGARLMESTGQMEPLVATLFGPDPSSPQEAPLSLVLKGTNYQIKVWNALLRIPPGTVTTYGRLAAALGAPKSARAIGSAVAKNSIAYLIPCHRVIREMGAFGQYRWGPERKKTILGWEAARKAS